MRRGSTRFRRSLHSDVDRYYGADAESSPIPGAGGSLENQITAMAPFAWFRGDSYVAAGGKVTAWVDKMDASHTLAQATPANQVNTPTADAALNNQLSATFVGAVSTFSYLSSKAASAWAFLHNGLGAETFMTYVPVAPSGSSVVAWSTYSVSATGPGARFTATTGTAFGLNNGAATYGTTSNAAVNTDGIGTYVGWAFKQADAPNNLTWTKAVAGATNAFVTVPSAADPAMALTLGANDGLGVSMRFGDLLVFNRRVTEPERAIIQAYMLERYAL